RRKDRAAARVISIEKIGQGFARGQHMRHVAGNWARRERFEVSCCEYRRSAAALNPEPDRPIVESKIRRVDIWQRHGADPQALITRKHADFVIIAGQHLALGRRAGGRGDRLERHGCLAGPSKTRPSASAATLMILFNSTSILRWMGHSFPTDFRT